jgi:DNA primase (bacterial type)
VSSTPIQQAKLKLPLPLLMEQLGLAEHAKPNARCPFHDDTNPSFSVFQIGNVWFFKCHAGCGTGDEISFLEKHHEITRSEAILRYLEMAGCAPSPFSFRRESKNGRAESPESLDWVACIDSLTDTHLEQLGNQRWYSRAFCGWLRNNRLVGLYNNCIAFPVYNSGTVVGAHYCLRDGSWRYHPQGTKAAPLIIGGLGSATQVHVFESQWDMFAFIDRTQTYPSESVAFVATRGAGNARSVCNILGKNMSVCAWPQNDLAGEKWFNDLCANINNLGKGLVPQPHKDLNDWVKSGAQGKDIYNALQLNEVVPAPSKGDLELAELLQETASYVKRFVVFTSEAQPTAIALWVAHAWVIGAFDYTPYLQITSPEKQCGKSRVLDCLEAIVTNAWRAVSPSEAVLFRKIDNDQPTLLLDETDALFGKGKDDRGEVLRALLNAGFERRARVPRCLNFGREVHEFAVFCPKAFAGIGSLPDTVTDRCIPVRLRKRRQNEPVQRFRRRDAELTTAPIRERFQAWAKDEERIKMLNSARPPLPGELSDRQADISEPLLAIADAAGGDWPQRARKALVQLCEPDAQEESVNVKLLADIRRVFEAAGEDRMPTHDLLERLIDLETDGPWAVWWESDFRHGNVKGPAAKLSKVLKRFGIKARVIRLSDGSTPRGFLKPDFMDHWDRYCPNPRNDAAEQIMQQCNDSDKPFDNKDVDVASVTDVASLHLCEERHGEILTTGDCQLATIDDPF